MRLSWFRSTAVAAAFLSASTTLLAQSFTLEQVMSAPFPSGMVAAPSGNLVAWVQNAQGVRNIWVAEGSELRARQVTAYADDDGQELGDLVFTPDGATIVFVRGGGPNRQAEIPNPLSESEPATRSVWSVALSGGEPVELAEGDGPVMSPLGDRVVYSRGKVVWSVPVDGSAKPSKLFTIRGSAGTLRWSPDGSRIAFVSGRDTHSFIGVFDLDAAAVRYLDPSVDRDRGPVWSPDGTRLAFIRVPSAGRRLPFAPVRESDPWSIRVADIATGEAREIWRAEEGRGSAFRNVVAEDQLQWGAGDRIVFPWERDGWTHLYSVPVAGGEPVLLTPGEFEAEDVALSPDRSQVFFSSNQGDIDRRHLWRVAVSGGRPSAVTAGRGVEWSPVVTAGGDAVAFLASDGVTPAHAAVVAGSGKPRPLAPETMPRDFPSARLVEPEQVIFSAADGMQIHGQLFKPADLRPGDRRPAVIFFHGGSRRQMLLGFHYRGYYHNAYSLNQYLAAKGYIVLAVNYRSGTGYGMEFREALNYGATGASEFNDVMGAGLYLRGLPDVDPHRIGLWGGSYGGYLTAMGLARASDLFAAGVDLHGVHDWNKTIRNFVPSYDTKDYPEFSRLAFESSPMASIDDWRSPVLVIHGDDDRNVPFSETIDLVGALRDRGVEVEQLVFPDEVHGFLLHRSWLAAYRAAAEFFDRKLAGDRPISRR